jgi:hypothetical protein
MLKEPSNSGSSFFHISKEVSMARVVIYLRDQEVSALQKLAQLEYRAPKAQAALIIRKELERLGLVSEESIEEDEQRSLLVSEDSASNEEALHDSLSS